MKKRHKAEEIIRILRDIEGSGNKTEAVARHNISMQTYYSWRKKYGAMNESEAKRLREVEKENEKLKRIVANQALMIEGLKDINSKKW
jgi:putative transposase